MNDASALSESWEPSEFEVLLPEGWTRVRSPWRPLRTCTVTIRDIEHLVEVPGNTLLYGDSLALVLTRTYPKLG